MLTIVLSFTSHLRKGIHGYFKRQTESKELNATTSYISMEHICQEHLAAVHFILNTIELFS